MFWLTRVDIYLFFFLIQHEWTTRMRPVEFVVVTRSARNQQLFRTVKT